jgi:hypothetical protein
MPAEPPVAAQAKAPRQLDLPLPDLNEEEEASSELSEEDLDLVENYGSAVSFLDTLDTKKLDK